MSSSVSLKERFRAAARAGRRLLLLLAAGLALGALGGLTGTAFGCLIRTVTAIRTAHPLLVWGLPLGGLIIVWLYGLKGVRPTDTNGVLLAIHTPASISLSTGPLIFLGSVITHLFGGSAGREGAALQLGGVLGQALGRLLRCDERDAHLFVMTGMSAVFSALFGAPVTAAVFAIEVASVGIFHFSALLPCLAASLTAARIAAAFGLTGDAFPLETAFAFTLPAAGGVVLISVVCGIVSILYCVALKKSHHLLEARLPNPYLRIALCGLAVAVLTALLRTNAYNGAGMDGIERAMAGEARWADFALKFLFTVLTMASGYKGGEIVPAMFIGASLGCMLGSVLGLPAGLGAAVGLLALFCGSLNCPVSSILLGLEMFGGANLPFFAVAAVVSYALSGNYGLYKEQKIVYSKQRTEFINRYTD